VPEELKASITRQPNPSAGISRILSILLKVIRTISQWHDHSIKVSCFREVTRAISYGLDSWYLIVTSLEHIKRWFPVHALYELT
jgi:hypothetical protein